jgi:serine/threonine protein kinase
MAEKVPSLEVETGYGPQDCLFRALFGIGEELRMKTTSCPDKESLFGYVVGTIPEAKAEAVTAHLAICQECQETVETLEGLSDTMLSALRHPAEGDAFADEPECRQVLKKLRLLQLGSPESAEPVALAVPPAPKQSSLKKLGDYELLEKLGEGGMGKVYKARHARLKKIVALKVLPKNRLDNEDAVARFEREIEAVGRLEHANIVRAMDAREVGGVRFLVMEYVDGLDLSEVVRRNGPLGIADAAEVIRQAAMGLGCSSENGLVHRDIKPSNLMLSPEGQVKILDLGLAQIQEADSLDGQVTGAGQVMGTPDYISPEQAEESHAVDIRTDIYSLGCTLYYLLTGRPPFDRPTYDTPMKKVMGHVRDGVPSVLLKRADVPKPIAALLDRMVAKDPGQRMSRPSEVVNALAPFCEGSKLIGLLREARRKGEDVEEKERPINTEEFRNSDKLETSLDGLKLVASMPKAAEPVESAPSEVPPVPPVAGAFDPYHIWLGIPPAEQPANHYRMLGLSLFESNPEVIRDAAARQMAHVRSYHLGQHAELSQKILDELGAAQACLLNPQKKATYDAELRKKLAAPKVVPVAIPPVATEAPLPKPLDLMHVSTLDNLIIPAVTKTKLPRYRSWFGKRKPPARFLVAAAGAAAFVLLLGIVISIAAEKGSVKIELSDPKAQVDIKIDGDSIELTGLDEPLKIKPGEHELEVTGKGFKTVCKSFTVRRGEEDIVRVTLESDQKSETTLEQADDSISEKRLGAIAELRNIYHEILVVGTPQQKTDLAKELLDAAEREGDDRIQRIAILVVASGLAFENGDFVRPFEVCDKIGKSFANIDPLNLKVQLLVGPAAKVIPQRAEAVAETSLQFGFRCLAVDRFQLADKLMPIVELAAKKSGREDLIYQSDFLKEDFRKVSDHYQRIKQFEQTLLRDPANAKANLEMGKYFCFAKNDWRKGLPMISSAKNTHFSSIADNDLEELEQADKGKNTEAEKKIKLADRWWDVSDLVAEQDRLPCRERSKYWYLKALGQCDQEKRKALSDRIVSRIDSVPSRPVTLRIHIGGSTDGGELVIISNDGVICPREHVLLNKVNHLSMALGSKNQNNGLYRLFPNAIDFSGTDVRSEWYNRPNGDIQILDISPDHVTFVVAHPWHFNDGRECDLDIFMTIGAGGFQIANRFTNPWNVKYYLWEPKTDNPGAEEGWSKIIARDPIDEQKCDQLNYRRDPQGHNRWNHIAHSPKLQQIGRLEYYAVVATREWDLPAGIYEIHTLVDDKIRVFLDGKKVMENLTLGNGSSVVSIPGGKHSFRVEYIQNTGLARLKFSLRKLDIPGTIQSQSQKSSPLKQKWELCYYGFDQKLHGLPPDMAKVIQQQPLDRQTFDNMEQFWGLSAPSEKVPQSFFAVVATSSLDAKKGKYKVHCLVDDGVRIFVDGKIVIDEWHNSWPKEYFSEMDLTEGKHDIRLEYFQNNGHANLACWIYPLNTSTSESGRITQREIESETSQKKDSISAPYIASKGAQETDSLRIDTKSVSTEKISEPIRDVKQKSFDQDKYLDDDWIDLLRDVNLNRDVVKGTWKREETGLTVAPEPWARIMLSLILVDGYDLHVKFTRNGADECVKVSLPTRTTACDLFLSGSHGQYHSLETIAGPPGAVKVKPGTLINGHDYVLDIQVRFQNNNVTINSQLDGIPLLSWSGKQESLNCLKEWQLPDRLRLGLGAWDSPVTFHSVQLRRIIPSNLAEFEGHYYKIIDTPMTWHLAKEYCEKMGGHLVQIESTGEQEFVKKLAGNNVNAYYYIDGTDEAKESDWRFSDGRSIKFANWLSGEPSNKTAKFNWEEHYVVMLVGKECKWNDCSGAFTAQFICEWDGLKMLSAIPVKQKVMPVRIPKESAKFGEHHYKLFDKAATWFEAKRLCEASGGHLARIESPEEQQFIEQLISSSKAEYFWLDGSNARVAGTWEDSEGNKLIYVHWDKGQPNNAGEGEHYLAINKNRYWHDGYVGYRTSYICEWDQ